MSRGNDSNSNQANGRSRTGRTKADRDNRSRQLNPQDIRYRQSRTEGSMESRNTPEGWRNRMSREDAARIQSNADRTGKDDGFKERSQRAAEKNEQK
jgi:hypothetical protein